MSIGQAKKDISSHPTAMGVTTPINKGDLHKSIDDKIKLYGIIQAFRDGSLPSNQQIDKALVHAREHSPVPIDKLSQDGQRLIMDVRDIIETARLMIMTKNQDELFQNFFFHTQETDTSRGAQSKDVLPASKGEIKKDAENASVHLRTLITLLLTNSEARKLLSDLGLVGRDLFATAAIKAGEKARPDEQDMEQVDKEAPSGEFKSADGRTLGKNETPKLELNVAGHKIQHDPKAPVAEGTVHTDPNGNSANAGERAQQAKSKAQDIKQKGQEKKEEAKDAGREAKATHDNHGTEGLKEKAKRTAEANDDPETRDKAKSKFAAFKDKFSANDDTREQTQAQKDKAKNFMNETLEESFPEERKQQFIYRLKKVVVDCQQHGDYDEAINFFLDKAENYKGHSKQLTNVAKDSTAAVGSDGAFQTAYEEFKTLLERFADGKSLNGVIDAVNDIYLDAKDDPELSKWFSTLDAYVRKALLEPGWILEDESTEQGRKIQKTGKQFFDHRYAGHKDNLFDELTAWFKALGEDPVNVRFGDDWKRLTKDILFDDNGGLTFKPDLWTDIKNQILPSLVNQVGYIPIPRIEYTDKQIDLVIENLILQGTNLLPNIVTLEANNFFKFSPYSNIKDQSHHRFTLKLAQIQADMRDVGFYFKKKTGFPKLHDTGLADVLLSGDGLSIDITLESAGKRRDHVFLVKNVDANVDHLKFSIHESKHDFAYKIFSPLAGGLVRKAVGVAVEQAIKTALGYLDDQLVEVRNRMEDAKSKDDPASKMEALKTAFQEKKAAAEHNKEKAKAKKDERGSQFAVVVDHDQSIIPNANPPHSLAANAQHAKEEAKKGETWHSPAFSIVDNTTGNSNPANPRS